MQVIADDGLQPAGQSFEVDDDLVLLSPSKDLYLLNETAAFLWRSLQQGSSLREAARALADAARQDAEQVERDCARLFADWRDTGLLTQRSTVRPQPNDGVRAVWPAPWPEARVDQHGSPTYQLNRFVFRLRAADPEHERIAREYLAYLATARNPEAGWLLELRTIGGRVLFVCNEQEIDSCPASELIPMLHGNLMVAAYRTTPCLLGLHAAAVTYDEACAVLAGVPGAGKSTLTAALLAAGFRFAADDTVLLAQRPTAVVGVTLRLGLKEGSWPVVGQRWPDLLTAPVQRRGDGKLVRYWLPPSTHRHDAGYLPLRARALFFPRYRAGAETSERPLRRAEALVKLTEAGYDVPSLLNPDVVDVLLEWLGTVQSRELVYSNLGEAIARVKAALSADAPYR